jgi:hypothetical protein
MAKGFFRKSNGTTENKSTATITLDSAGSTASVCYTSKSVGLFVKEITDSTANAANPQEGIKFHAWLKREHVVAIGAHMKEILAAFDAAEAKQTETPAAPEKTSTPSATAQMAASMMAMMQMMQQQQAAQAELIAQLTAKAGKK